MKNFIFVLSISLFVIACKLNDKTPLLYGQWKGISWKVNGVESDRNAKSVKFQFNDDRTYSTSYESEAEHGVYRLNFANLYTTGENKIEKMVKLATLTADSMIMDMNRAGTSEQMTLVKTK